MVGPPADRLTRPCSEADRVAPAERMPLISGLHGREVLCSADRAVEFESITTKKQLTWKMIVISIVIVIVIVALMRPQPDSQACMETSHDNASRCLDAW